MRQSVSDLLGRVGRDAPHLIVFPAVVGGTSSQSSQGAHSSSINASGHRDTLINKYLSQGEGAEEEDLEVEEEEDVEKEAKDTMLKNCFAAIVEKLEKSNPRCVIFVIGYIMCLDCTLSVSY